MSSIRSAHDGVPALEVVIHDHAVVALDEQLEWDTRRSAPGTASLA